MGGVSGGIRLLSDDFLRNKTAPALSPDFRLGGAGLFMGIGGEGNCLCQMKKDTRIGRLLLGADNRT